MKRFFKQLYQDYKYTYWKRDFVYYLFERLILLRPARSTRLYNTPVYDGMTINDFLEQDLLLTVLAKLHILDQKWRDYLSLDDDDE